MAQELVQLLVRIAKVANLLLGSGIGQPAGMTPDAAPLDFVAVLHAGAGVCRALLFREVHTCFLAKCRCCQGTVSSRPYVIVVGLLHET